MSETKERTLGYLRADWLNENPDSINLGSCLQQAITKLKNVEERSLERPGGHLMRLLATRKHREGILLHITAETPGEAASIVPQAKAKMEEADVSTVPPPASTEFMDGDAFIYVNKNNLCLCATALHEATIRDFMIDFFKKAKLRRDASQFDLIKAANISKVKLIQSEGIKEIELRSSLYEATLHYLDRQGRPQGLMGSLSKQIKALIGNANDANEDALVATLILRTDGRRNGLALGEKRMKSIGLDILKNEKKGDDFVIVTKSGKKISPTEIYMRSSARIEALGKSVKRDKAWAALEKFYQTLQESGALEE